jgi:molecular chaperone IbpA
MATALSLTPLLRQTVGFDRFNDLFETLNTEGESKNAFPPYDIIKNDENAYQIVMAVAGYDEKDVTITLEYDTLTVSGKSESDENETISYLHKGIARRAFERNFRLADHMKVLAASMKNGLLIIDLEREIPEEKKPQIIAINRLD